MELTADTSTRSRLELLEQMWSTPATKCGVVLFAFATSQSESPAQETSKPVQWSPQEIQLKATAEHSWWTFPASAQFVHETSGRRLEVQAFWNGDRDWVIALHRRSRVDGPGSRRRHR